MNNRLDNFFKNKLDNQEIPFDESNWEDVLTQLDERDKDRNKPLWWIFGLGFMLLSAIVLWFKFMPVQTEVNINNQADNHVILENEQKDLVEFLPNKFSAPKVEIENSTANILGPDSKLTSSYNLSGIPEKKGVIVEKKSTNGAFSLYENLNIEKEVYENVLTNISEQRRIESEFLPTPFQVKEERVFILPLAPLVLKDADLDFETEGYSNPVIPIRKFNNRQLVLGVSGKGIFETINNKVAGFGGGLFLNYHFNKKWFIGSGLNYLDLSNDFKASQTTEQVTYGFGRTVEKQTLTPKALSILEAPINLGYKLNRHSISLGFSANYLINIVGEKQIIAPVNVQPRVVAISTGKIPEVEGISKLNWSGQLSYGYQFRAIGIGLTGKYYQNNYFQESDVSKQNLLSLEAVLKYNLFSK